MSHVMQSYRLQRRPVRGFFGGLFLGLGAVILLAIAGVAAFSAWWPFAVIVGGCAVIGLLVGLFSPAR